MLPRRLVFAALLLAGCSDPLPAGTPPIVASASPSAAALPSASPSPRPAASIRPDRDPRTPPTRDDVGGRYHMVTESQSTTGPTYECYAEQFFMTWELDQRGDEVGGKLVYHPVANPPADVEYRSEFVYGTIANGLVTLDGEYQVTDETGKPLSEEFVPVTYRLRFVESTGHLVGTRNGELFYLRPILPGNEEKCR